MPALARLQVDYWLFAVVLLLLFAWPRRKRSEVLVLTALAFLFMRLVGWFLPAATPCLAPNADAALGLVTAFVLAVVLPINRWLRWAATVLLMGTAGVRAYALGCRVPAGWVVAGAALLAVGLGVLVVGLVPAARRRWQHVALRVYNRAARLARLRLTPRLQAALGLALQRCLGLEVERIHPLADDGAHASTPTIVTGHDAAGRPARCFVKLLSANNWRANLASRQLRWLQHRGRLQAEPLLLTLKSLAEHEHYMALRFADLGVPVPRPRCFARLAPQVYAIVSDYLEGSRSLRDVAEVSLAYVDEALRALATLRAADCAHRDVKASNLMVLPGQRFAIVDLGSAVNGAGPRRQAEDLADLLVVLAMHHDPAEVIAHARAAIGMEGLRQAVPYLRRSLLNTETQKLMPLPLPGELRRLIGQQAGAM